MGFQLSRIKDGSETIKMLVEKNISTDVYARITSVSTHYNDEGVFTHVHIEYNKSKSDRDNRVKPSLYGFYRTTKTVVSDVTNPSLEMGVGEALMFKDNPQIGDVISLPENMVSFSKLPIMVVLKTEVLDRALIYNNADFRKVFTDNGISITDVDPD